MHIVLHIGSNKTGSSAIQTFLYQNTDALSQASICYPIAGQENASHYPLARPNEFARLFPEIEREADGYKTVILSSEEFHTIDPRPLASALSRHTVTVIAYVREHLSYLSSWYRESVKSTSMSASFEHFAYFTQPQYHHWLLPWQEAFPQDFRVFIYDRSILPNHSVLDHFLSEIEFSGLSHPEIEANSSISGNLLFAKRLANLFLSPQAAQKYTYELQNLSQFDPAFTAPLYIEPATANKVHHLAKLDREILRSRFGINFSNLVPPSRGALAPDVVRWDADRGLIIEKSEDLGLNFGHTLQNLATKNLF